MIIYSRTALAQDKDGNLTRLVTKDSLNALRVNDEETYDLLHKILKELRKSNFQLSLLTDNDINDVELGD